MTQIPLKQTTQRETQSITNEAVDVGLNKMQQYIRIPVLTHFSGSIPNFRDSIKLIYNKGDSN